MLAWMSPYAYCCFFYNITATTEIYTLSLHDALPIFSPAGSAGHPAASASHRMAWRSGRARRRGRRSEEHTSELQSRRDLVCRLLLEKKKNRIHVGRDGLQVQKTHLRPQIAD